MEDNKSLSMAEKQEILFEMLKDVDAFCRKNGIRYSISDGTMLGAVRHGGFIPWDDDADICMLREDFDRFASTYKSDRFHMLYKTAGDDEYFFGGFIKINDPSTYVRNKSHKDLTKYGITLDIFPFEDVPQDPDVRKSFMHNIRRIDNRLYHSQKKDIFSIMKSHRYSSEKWWDKLNEAVHDVRYKGSSLVGQSVCVRDDRVVLQKSMFDRITDIDFNGYKLRGFEDSHKYLEFMFGADYMTPKQWDHGIDIYRY